MTIKQRNGIVGALSAILLFIYISSIYPVVESANTVLALNISLLALGGIAIKCLNRSLPIDDSEVELPVDPLEKIKLLESILETSVGQSKIENEYLKVVDEHFAKHGKGRAVWAYRVLFNKSLKDSKVAVDNRFCELEET